MAKIVTISLSDEVIELIDKESKTKKRSRSAQIEYDLENLYKEKIND